MNQEIINISNGNPGTLSVFTHIIEYHPSSLSDIMLKFLRHNVKGSDIWILYKQSDKDIDKFVSFVLSEEFANLLTK